uniref:Uncharacterized protein n=1 Tax=Candidatus Kentrum sp. TUN TaxID=2126343 RepID=A0A450ZJL6_9GAMM|nr:MAG: hypothetical protein BECKTUN1418F_GA0071002_10344 [Candidatus Kentron sp. TUN]VFK55936.1 MAG: hypothetical protein BECKTUN1418E_GA0071001_10353 [Candidatus Kentron sp. TUN]VFK61463.1 MAG: hypothetical protein BECKTUN1418D_GA0071000_11526 [Candidatus Kentron sp. TUN]
MDPKPCFIKGILHEENAIGTRFEQADFRSLGVSLTRHDILVMTSWKVALIACTSTGERGGTDVLAWGAP